MGLHYPLVLRIQPLQLFKEEDD